MTRKTSIKVRFTHSTSPSAVHCIERVAFSLRSCWHAIVYAHLAALHLELLADSLLQVLYVET